MITTWYLQSHRTWDRSCHSCIGSPSSPEGPSRRGSLCRLVTEGTPDRSKLFGSTARGRGFMSSEIRLDILGTGDPFRFRNLDRNRTVEVVVLGQINPSEPALAQQSDHPVAADFEGIAERERNRRTVLGSLTALGFRQALRLSHRPNPPAH